MIESLKPLNTGIMNVGQFTNPQHLDEGCYRVVYTSLNFPGVVMKVTHDNYSQVDSEEEMENEVIGWNALVEAGYAEIVPAFDVITDNNNNIQALFVEYIELQLEISDNEFYERVNSILESTGFSMYDAHTSNCGWTKEGRFVILDGASIIRKNNKENF